MPRAGLGQVDYKFYPEREVGLVLAPFSGGQEKFGVEEGPKYLLHAGMERDLRKLGWKTSIVEAFKSDEYDNMRLDKTDVQGKVLLPKLVGHATQRVFEAVKKVAHQGHLPLTLGGDHSVAIGTVAAVLTKYPNAGLIWVDAHADINTMSGTESGHLHGCPVSILMGLDKEHIPKEFDWVPHLLKPEKIAYIGLREVDEDEKRILAELNIAAFSMHHVDRFGINAVVEMAVKAVSPNGDEPIMVSYDVDGIDPIYTPATGTPVRGGLNYREGLFLTERIAETGRLVALDVVECNPHLAATPDHAHNTISLGCSIARCALGETLLHRKSLPHSSKL
uniref:Arginase n=1 Tax=Angomonas desouzai TaxID=59800 RepID=U5KM02_9TRYP|nr:arginase [Angomonas desouzai]